MKKLIISAVLLILSTNVFATVDQLCYSQCMRSSNDAYGCEKKCTFFFSNEPRTPTDGFNVGF